MVTDAVDITILAELNPLEPVTAVPLFTFHLGAWQVVVSNHAAHGRRGGRDSSGGPSPGGSRRRGSCPGACRTSIESVCVFLREQMARPMLGSHTDQYIGFLWTTFFFILTLNLVAMIPTERIVSLATGKPSHFGGPATANIWITGALAVVSFVMTHVYGIRQHGLSPLPGQPGASVPGWLLPLIYPLELLSMFVRPFTLAIRLFANIIAGHMVLAIDSGLDLHLQEPRRGAGFGVACVALSFLELLVAFIQAYIFTLLSTLYIGSAVNPEH